MPEPFRQILGIRFYTGNLEGLLNRTLEGGLIAVPSAPVLVDLAADPAHRAALEHCDFAITDSSYMVILWALLKGERLPRISGLRYLRAILDQPEFCKAGATFWVMPSPEDALANREWLAGRGITVGAEDCYLAPHYPRGALSDPALLAQIEARRPRFVVMCVGGGVQERLGHYLRQNLPFRPAILCTGAAIAFLSGRQTGIPVWADRLFLGWLFRILSDPSRFLPRFWKAARLAPLLFRRGERSAAG